MKNFTVIFTFGIEEEDLKSDNFKDFKNSILSGELQRSFDSGNSNKKEFKSIKITMKETPTMDDIFRKIEEKVGTKITHISHKQDFGK